MDSTRLRSGRLVDKCFGQPEFTAASARQRNARSSMRQSELLTRVPELSHSTNADDSSDDEPVAVVPDHSAPRVKRRGLPGPPAQPSQHGPARRGVPGIQAPVINGPRVSIAKRSAPSSSRHSGALVGLTMRKTKSSGAEDSNAERGLTMRKTKSSGAEDSKAERSDVTSCASSTQQVTPSSLTGLPLRKTKSHGDDAGIASVALGLAPRGLAPLPLARSALSDLAIEFGMTGTGGLSLGS